MGGREGGYEGGERHHLTFSTCDKSERASSKLMISISRSGSTEPETWMMSSSSKHRITCGAREGGREGGREDEYVCTGEAMMGGQRQKSDGGEKRGEEGVEEGEEPYLHNGIALSNVGQELVAQPFALRRAFDQARDVHKL